MEPTNPYQAPAASVTTAQIQSELRLRPARRVRASRGGAWLNSGFASVGQSIVGWTLIFIALSVVYVGILILSELLKHVHVALSYLPSLLFYPAATVLWGGVMVACHNGPLTFKKVINGMRPRLGPLLVLGILGALVSLATLIPMVLVDTAGPSLLSGATSFGYASPLWVLVLVVLVLVVLSLVMAALWFAPALVALGNVSPSLAIRRSFSACLKNFVPFMVFSLLAVVLTLAAILLIVLIAAIVAGVLGFATSFDGVNNAFGLSGIVFGLLFYVAAVFLMVSVTGAAQYAGFKDIFAYQNDS